MKNVYIPEMILQDKVNGFHHSGTMYGIIDGESPNYPISFVGADKLNHKSGIKYEYPVTSVVEVSGDASFEYCTYIPGLKEFFEQAKEMKIGRELPFADLIDLLGKMLEAAPDDFKGMVKFNDNWRSNFPQKTPGFLSTIFLNVDELE